MNVTNITSNGASKKIFFSFLILVGVLALGISQANAQFVVGDRVQATAHVNVRSTPGGTYLGSAMMGDFGTIVGGPVVAPLGTSTPFTWWDVNFDIGVDGWSVGDYLMKVPTATTTLPIVCGDLNGDSVINVTDVTLIINYAFRGHMIPSGVNADVNGDELVNVQDVNLIIDAAFRGAPNPTGCVVQQPNQPPIITSFTGPSALDLYISGAWSFRLSDPEGFPVNYSINFGDTVTSTTGVATTSAATITRTHAYSQPGTYNVALTGIDQGGLTVQQSLLVTVAASSTNQEPVMQSFTGPGVIVEDQSGTWSARATDANNDILSYNFMWGDSSPSSPVSGVSGQTVSRSHVYTNPGTYKPVVSVDDGRPGVGGSSSSFMWVSVTPTPTSTNQPPVINSFSGPATVVVGQNNVWPISVSDPDSTQFTYSIDWGDGTPSSTYSTSSSSGSFTFPAYHVYYQPSQYYYSIIFTVRDEGGRYDTEIKNIVVTSSTSNRPPVVNTFRWFDGSSNTTVGTDKVMWFKASDPDGDFLTYEVNWGDGNIVNSGPFLSGHTLSAGHTYVTAGTYSVTAKASDSRGGQVSTSPLTLFVSGPSSTSTVNQPPVINSFSGPTSATVGQTTNWQAMATDPNGNPITYVFNWGDWTSSTTNGVSGATVSNSKIYSTPGSYTVSLQAWDTPYSGWVQQTRPITIYAASSTQSPLQYPTPIYQKSIPTYLTPSASVIDSMQAQLLQISTQLLQLLQQIR